jgi:enoyl-CoA hydratase
MTVLVQRDGAIATVVLNRPEVLNALSGVMLDELTRTFEELARDATLRAVVLTGAGPKAFAAGADIGELRALADAQAGEAQAVRGQAMTLAIERLPVPVIAAVNGFALGGGCELAMQCDLIIAADNAKFGQPEIKLGVIPGIGGTQRLTHAVGKAKAMDLCLTGRMMDAVEAERAGLVARVVPLASLMDEALKTAETIASMSLPALMLAKEAVNRAFETTLAEGVRFERRVFHSLFATEDQREGMAAFVEKRPPKFKNR